MNIYSESGQPVNLTATGTIQTRDCRLVGFYVNSTTAGTIVFRRGAGGTSSGTAVSTALTPAAGYHPFPMDCPGGVHATIGGTLDVTFFVT